VNARTALEIADVLEVEMPTLKNMDCAAAVLRRQHAEIERLTKERDAVAAAMPDLLEVCSQLAAINVFSVSPAMGDIVMQAYNAVDKASRGRS
jgi:hypothetical protein